jgi:excisionase family DNA binding protein
MGRVTANFFLNPVFPTNPKIAGNDMKDYLTVGEASKIFRVNRDTVLAWINKGVVKVSKTIGGHNRISIEEVERLKKKMGLE